MSLCQHTRVLLGINSLESTNRVWGVFLVFFFLCTQQHWNAQSSKIEGAQLSKSEPWFGHRREEDSRYDLTPVW